MSPLTDDVFARATRCIAVLRRPLLISHARPDGDALGSLVAMRSMLREQGADATALLFDKWPQRYAFLESTGSTPVLGEDLHEADLGDRDGVIILDTCAYSQIAPLADWLRATTIPKLAVDHHLTRDELADSYLIDESAAANCLILYDWARATGWPIDRVTCEALFVGIALDTGWFRHSNTDERVLAAAGDLVARQRAAGFSPRGAGPKGKDSQRKDDLCTTLRPTVCRQPHELYEALFQQDSPGRLRLLGAAISSLELSADDRLAVMTLKSHAFDQADATPADTEDIVNEPLRIKTVAVSVLLVDQGDGPIRVSLRSKPPQADGDPDVDVAAIAQTFGGGGHRRAAGARVTASLFDLRPRIIERVAQVLR